MVVESCFVWKERSIMDDASMMDPILERAVHSLIRSVASCVECTPSLPSDGTIFALFV